MHVLCFDLQLEESYRRTSSRMFLYILSWISMIFHVIFLTLALGMFKEFLKIRYLCNALKAESPFARVFLFIHVPFNFGVAAALFYLAELVEEYTVVTAKVIKCTIAVSIIKLNQSVNFK